MFEKLSNQDRHTFTERYENLAVVLNMPLQKKSIKALIYFWDISYIFEFFLGVEPVKIEFISNHPNLCDIDKQRLVKSLGITSLSSFLHMRRGVENPGIFYRKSHV